MSKLTKKQCNDIAKVMIASTSLSFDITAFVECDDMVDEYEIHEILAQLKKECVKIITSVQSKYEDQIDIRSTQNIIESMFFE